MQNGISAEEKIERLKQTYLQTNTENVVFISAEKKENLDELRGIMFGKVKEKHFALYHNWLPEHTALWDQVEETAEKEVREETETKEAGAEKIVGV